MAQGAEPLRRPTVDVQAGRRPLAAHMADVWRAREILYFLVWRDVKVRYKQTAVGVSWAVIQPLATTLLTSRPSPAMPTRSVPGPLQPDRPLSL
jgi:lipopolysaccharide transport system permease protein